MSGLLALLDDVAGIARLAAASLDDVAGQAAKSGAKAAGAVIDDTAVTPKYVQGIPAARELPIVAKIAGGSLINKLVILLPLALILSSFAPFVIQPLLMLGGLYLCYEGAEKIWHLLRPAGHGAAAPEAAHDPEHLERTRVKGAIKTDFILSAEIMTIALSQIPGGSLWFEAAVLAIVGFGITLLVYGSVALIVKADDLGLHLAKESGSAPLRAFGRGLVRAMPGFMRLLAGVGTAAMIWVGGAIVLHGLEGFGLVAPAHLIEHMAEASAHALPGALAPLAGLVHWAVTAFFDGICGMILGFCVLAVISACSGLLGKNATH